MDIIDEYRKTEGVNFSTLKQYLKTPAHYKFAIEHADDDEEEKKAFIIGRAMHCLILEPQHFQSRYAFIDLSKRPVPESTFRKKVNKEWRDNLIASFKEEGKLVLSMDDMEMVQTMVQGILNNKAATALLKGCIKEQIIEWTDPDTGVKCKALVDFHDPERAQVIHGDAKSMVDVSPRAVSNFMAKYMTHMQLAFYGDGLSTVYGKHFDCPFIIASEKSQPYLCQPYFVDLKAIEAGRVMYKSLLNLHKKCKATGKWGGYDSINENLHGVIVVDLPPWAYFVAEGSKVLQEDFEGDDIPISKIIEDSKS